MKYVVLIFCFLFFYGCSTANVKDMMKIETSTAQERQLQIKRFNTIDSDKILLSSIATLQDLGFNIDEINKDFGLVSASKIRDARETKTQVGIIFLTLLSPSAAIAASRQSDNTQEIKASVVIATNKKNKTTFVRLTAQRIVKNQEGAINEVETIKDKEIYQQFYEKLSKSVFLEANEL
ncbi:hypothetical protein JG677_00155 [Campylobacter sp. TTU-622]|uniref:hypothetical protein n=1 Tax=unclassified Campylobacter TaxID=2593542 RepID=UPI0019083275|nr:MULTISPECIES: hypothetical protein [unclassified Campylobacter]MBK1972486.1 hypothetical protein [Campylobacter sp. TTU-622]MBK1991076.1 hypothetical protein [Campylobacter sp. 2018MI34]